MEQEVKSGQPIVSRGNRERCTRATCFRVTRDIAFHGLKERLGKKTSKALFLVRIRMLRTTTWKEIVLVCLSADNLATECILVSSRYRTTGFSASKTRRTNVITRFFPVSTGEESSAVVLDHRPWAHSSSRWSSESWRHFNRVNSNPVDVEFANYALNTPRTADRGLLDANCRDRSFYRSSKCLMSYGTQCRSNDLAFTWPLHLFTRSRARSGNTALNYDDPSFIECCDLHESAFLYIALTNTIYKTPEVELCHVIFCVLTIGEKGGKEKNFIGIFHRSGRQRL